MLINIDWLQIHLKGPIYRNPKYTFKKLEYSSKVFYCIEDIYLKDNYIASMVSEPISPIINQNTVIIKIINKVLYSPHLFNVIDYLIADLHLTYIGITRLDVCSDFRSFANGLKPETVIKNFITQRYRKIGQGKGSCHFEQKTELNYETLTFGTGKSLIRVYLYNKSKELRDVKMKPYIVDNWRASGLNVKKDIWRLEFSIKGNTLNLIDQETGELKKVTIENLKDREFLTNLYYSLQYQYFRFKERTYDKNISRWPDVKLLPEKPTTWKRLFIKDAGDANRSDKIFIKKLEKLNDELRDYANYREEELKELMAEFVIAKGLQDYYLKKVNGKSTNLINYLKQEQETMYEEIIKKAENNEKEQNLFKDEEFKEKVSKIVLKTKL